MWIDTHCHLEFADFCQPTAGADGFVDERPEVLARAAAAGLSQLIVIGSGRGMHEVETALHYARSHSHLYAAIGVHPHDACAIEAPECLAPLPPQPSLPSLSPQEVLVGEPLWARIAQLAEAEPRVVAIGETGLDYHYQHSTPGQQQALLRRFVRLSQKLRKPLSLHIRDAHGEAQRILAEEGGSPCGGVVHCFTGGLAEARTWLDLGFYISLSGIVTFKSAAAIQEAARFVPAERLLLETDCPYLAPMPLRGKRNEPAYLVHTAVLVAKLRGVALAQLQAETTQAAQRLFGLGTS